MGDFLALDLVGGTPTNARETRALPETQRNAKLLLLDFFWDSDGHGDSFTVSFRPLAIDRSDRSERLS